MAQSFKRVPWQSQITEVAGDSLFTHSVDQRDIIRDFNYEEMVFFLLKGVRPTPVQRDLLRGVLVAYISHGITGQSTLAVMQAADCRSDFLHSLIAGFSVGSGHYHLGGLKAAMEEFEALAAIDPDQLETHIHHRLACSERIMGFGHRYHARDPRVEGLLELTGKHQFTGTYTTLAQRVGDLLGELKGIAMNIEGAVASILLDLGFDARIGYLFIILGRSPMFAAAYLERLAQERRPFQRIEVCDLLQSNPPNDFSDLCESHAMDGKGSSDELPSDAMNGSNQEKVMYVGLG